MASGTLIMPPGLGMTHFHSGYCELSGALAVMGISVWANTSWSLFLASAWEESILLKQRDQTVLPCRLFVDIRASIMHQDRLGSLDVLGRLTCHLATHYLEVQLSSSFGKGRCDRHSLW